MLFLVSRHSVVAPFPAFDEKTAMLQQGQKVSCIDDKFPLGIEEMYVALPKEGETYTIRDITPGQGFDLQPEIAVTLVELHNPMGKGGLERSFNAERFAPLEETEDVQVVEEEVHEPATV